VEVSQQQEIGKPLAGGLTLIQLGQVKVDLDNFHFILRTNILKGLSHEMEQGSNAISIDRSPFKDVLAG
jgi:hypothetical protein